VGRLPRVELGETSQSLVMARAAEPADPVVLGLRPVLLVASIPRVVELLVGVFGMHLRFEFGEPEVEFARVTTNQWNGGAELDLRRTGDAISPTCLALDVGVPVDPLHRAAVDAGFTVVAPPAHVPWHRREFSLRLAEGHLLTICGPTFPDRP
jgi:hypothetical protein